MEETERQRLIRRAEEDHAAGVTGKLARAVRLGGESRSATAGVQQIMIERRNQAQRRLVKSD